MPAPQALDAHARRALIAGTAIAAVFTAASCLAVAAAATLGALLVGLALPAVALPFGWRWAYVATSSHLARSRALNG